MKNDEGSDSMHRSRSAASKRAMLSMGDVNRPPSAAAAATMKDEKSFKIDHVPEPSPSSVTNQKDSGDVMKIMCFDLTRLTKSIQFVCCCFGVFFFYLIYGYVQELIFRLEGMKPFGWYLTLIQFACYSLFGSIETTLRGGDHTRRVPLRSYVFIALLTVATMGFSNSSLGYLNYPTQVIFKCCKLIPVLIGGILIQGKKYGVLDVTACVLMSAGLIFFTLADSSVSPTFNFYGIILISSALCADAVIGNVQEKVMKQHSGSNSEMVLYSYSIGFVYILIGQVVSGQIFDAFTFCYENPVRTYGYGVIFSLTGYLGVNCVLTLVKTFGALPAVTVTTCRKAVTMVLSFVFFAKPFTIQYVWSGLIVVLGIYINIYSKNRDRWNAAVISYYHRYVRGRSTIAQTNFENVV